MARVILSLSMTSYAIACNPHAFTPCAVESAFDTSESAASLLGAAGTQPEFESLVAEMKGGGDAEGFYAELLEFVAGGEEREERGRWVLSDEKEGYTSYAWQVPITDPSGQRYNVASSFDAENHSDDAACSHEFFTPCTLGDVTTFVDALQARFQAASDSGEEQWEAILNDVQTAKERGDKSMYVNTAFYVFVWKILDDDMIAIAHAENPALAVTGKLKSELPHPLPIDKFIAKTLAGGGWVNYDWYVDSLLDDKEHLVHKISFLRPVTAPNGDKLYVAAGFQADACTQEEGCAQADAFCSCQVHQRRLLFGGDARGNFEVKSDGDCLCTH